jgi:hypothetical protein
MDRQGIALLAVAALFSAGASAQLFKCKGADGKIVYSDTRCEAAATQGAVPPGVSNRAHAIEEKAAADKAASDKASADARLQAEALVEAARKAGLTGGAPPPAMPGAAPAPSKPAGPSAADQERLRSLQTTLGQAGASAEQKAAAQLEIHSIQSGREERMSSSERSRRDSLTTDLVSADAKKRQRSMQEIRDIYNR